MRILPRLIREAQDPGPGKACSKSEPLGAEVCAVAILMFHRAPGCRHELDLTSIRVPRATSPSRTSVITDVVTRLSDIA